MVATPHNHNGLPVSGPDSASSLLTKMQLLRWNHQGTTLHERLLWSEGLDVANQNRASGADRKMFLTCPLIEQAISDGALVDCSQPPFDELNRQAGIKVHVALTPEAFHDCVYPLSVSEFPIQIEELGQSSPGSPKLPPGQDMKGRYWDIVWMLHAAIRGQRDDSSCIFFQLYVVPNEGGNARLVKLKCVAGPDDEGDLCLTIMLPEQD
jgi:hypothetical protein